MRAATVRPRGNIVTAARRALHRCMLVAANVALAAFACTASAQPAPPAPPPDQPLLRIEAGMHTGAVSAIATDASGRVAVTASPDKTVRVWDLPSGRLLQVLRPPIGPGNEGMLYAVALSADATVVATAGWTGYDWNRQFHVLLFDRASGQLLRRLQGPVASSIVKLAFSPDGRWLAATLSGTQGVRVWDWRNGGQPLAERDYGNSSFGAVWMPDGQLLTSSHDGKLRRYTLAAGRLDKLAEVQASGGARPHGLAATADGTRVAVAYADVARVEVLDGATLAPLFAADTAAVDNGQLAAVAFSSDGQALAATGSWRVQGRTLARVWPLGGRGPPVDTAVAANTVAALTALPGGGWLLGASDPTWGVLDARGVWREAGAAPMPDLRTTFGTALPLADGGKRVQFGFALDGSAPYRFVMATRALQAGALSDGAAPRTSGLPVTDWQGSLNPMLQGLPITLAPRETSRSLAIEHNGAGLVLGGDWSLRYIASNGQRRWATATPGVAWGVNIPREGQMLVAALGDGTLRWYRLADGKEVLALYAHTDRKRWVLWTPTGYYDASPGAEELIGWHLNRGQTAAADFFPASRLRATFYRPDVIDHVLDTLDETQALAMADTARNRPPTAAVAAPLVAQILPPVVELLAAADVATTTPNVKLRVRSRSAADAPVTGWRVRVNGQAAPATVGAGGSGPAADERELSFSVPAQDSVVQLFAENRHGTSSPATVKVTWKGAPPPPPPPAPPRPSAAASASAAGPAATAAAQAGDFQIRPKLYVLAIGVGAYQHADIPQLALSAKDATDFANTMRRQQGRLYREVEVRLLTDATATADAVVNGLEWMQKQVTQHDVGMIFIAGHGLNDATQGYTFLPVDADPERLRRTGVAMEEFRKTLANLPGKVVFFFDTCHSGNVLGPARRSARNDVLGVINELTSAENGVVVFSSSTGRQYSLESADWGNGAFTKALVEGLDGAADYQKTGRITHKMLDLYISERVKALTKGQQSPVTQAPGGVPDFPLALLQ